MRRKTAVKTATKKKFPIIKRQQAEGSMNEHLSFEQLISDLSARFVNIVSDQVDREIEYALQRVLEFFQVDRCGLLGIPPDQKRVYVTHMACAESIEPVSGGIELTNLYPWIYEKVVLQKQAVRIERLEEMPESAKQDRASCTAMGILSFLNIPLFIDRKVSCLIFLNAIRRERSWPEEYVPRLRLLGEILVNALARKQMEEQLKTRLQEIENLRQQLEKENIYLRDEAKLQCFHEEIVGESDALKRVMAQAKKVAQTESTVLIMGETGTGKELIARAIHCHSKRSNRVLVKVDCASLPSALIESELFGREKGAYTGALARQIGRFELADGSTIFLDEIGDLPLELQSKLLRVLQNGEFERLGSPKTIQINVRVIAATNRNLEEAVNKGRFREDLYYRLKVFPIQVPPLRERHEDIPLLVHAFLNELSGKMGKKIYIVPESTIEMLKQYQWPGNVRELRNIIEQAVIITDGDVLQVNLPQGISGSIKEMDTLEQVERQHIIKTLKKTGWRIKGRNGAAQLLGLKPSTLYAKMEKLGIPTNREKGRHIDQ
jgi:formate hydrogenlyase transcriptional activator